MHLPGSPHSSSQLRFSCSINIDADRSTARDCLVQQDCQMQRVTFFLFFFTLFLQRMALKALKSEEIQWQFLNSLLCTLWCLRPWNFAFLNYTP